MAKKKTRMYYYFDKLKYDKYKELQILNRSRVKLLDDHYLIANDLVYTYIGFLEEEPYKHYDDYDIDPTGKFLIPSANARKDRNDYNHDLDEFTVILEYKTGELVEMVISEGLANQLRRLKRLKDANIDINDQTITYRLKNINRYFNYPISKLRLERLAVLVDLVDLAQSRDIVSGADDGYDAKAEFLKLAQSKIGTDWKKIYV